MAIEYITDNNPQYLFNRHTTYENTVLQEHASILSGLRETSTITAQLETQGRMFIGLCMKGKSTKHIDNNFDNYYKEEISKLGHISDIRDKSNLAYNRAWIRLVNEAMDHFMDKYKVDGSKAKIAIVDDVLSDGRRVVEPDEVQADGQINTLEAEPDNPVEFSDE
jgi:hypothetical protein